MGALRALPAWLAGLLLLAASAALYWSGLRSPLVFDDGHLQEWAIQTRYADAMLRFASRWVSDTTFSWVYAAFGYNLIPQRVFNLAAHAAAASALFIFAARLGQAVLQEPRARWLALGGAALFLVHPVAVYAVGYLIQRSIVLATLFSIVSLICVLEALLAPSRRALLLWSAGAALAYLLAVFSKEHAVMLPAAAVALVIAVRGISWPLAMRIGLAALPFAVLAAFMIFRSRSILGVAYEPFAADVLATRASQVDPSLIYPLSALNQAALFFRYLATWLLPWPGWMAIDIRVPFPRGLADPAYLFALLAWLAWPAAATWLVLKRGRAGLAGFAMLFPWLLALTEVSVVRVQEPFVLYRSYLWMSAPAALLPLLFSFFSRRIVAAVVVAACAAFVPLAHDRLDTLSSTMKAWQDALRKHPGEYVPYIERAYVGRGLAYLDERRMPEAAADFAHALQLNPKLPEAYLARGTALMRAARFKEAEFDFDQAISLEPRYGAAWHKRCLVKLATGRLPDALKDCETALPLNHRNHELYINLGVIYRELARRAEAEASYRKALDFAPRNPSAHYNYGVLLLDEKRLEEARRHFQVACDAKIATACALLRR